jgi:CBS domain-containing protein
LIVEEMSYGRRSNLGCSLVIHRYESGELEVETGQMTFQREEKNMSKAYEVMTHALATCAPETNVAQVATIMRDRDVGNVLVVDNGRLCGIVTDRDLALQALTGKDDPLQTPISRFMNTKVVTGETTWSLERVAKEMAKHQVRRIPIVLDGQLVGIVSLGDVARREHRKGVVTKSLKAVSTPIDVSRPGRSRRGRAMLGLWMAALAATGLAWLTWNHYRSGAVCDSSKERTV